MRTLPDRLAVVTSALVVGLLASPTSASPLIIHRSVVATGLSAPGPAGAEHGSFEAPVINAQGTLAYRGGLAIGPGGVDSNGNVGVFLIERDGTATAVLEGSPAPGAAAGVVFDFPNEPRLNDSGEFAFSSSLRQPGPAPFTNGVFKGDDTGNLDFVTLNGGAAPGIPSAVISGSFSPAGITDDGDVLYILLLEQGPGGVDASNDSGIFLFDGPGSGTLLHREGGPAPGRPAGATFAQFSNIFGLIAESEISAAGDVAFFRTMTQGVAGVTAATDAGVFGPDGLGGETLLAREGVQAPGAPAGALHDSSFRNLYMNGTGQVAYRGGLANGPSVDDGNDTGIWFSDGPGSVGLLAREGDAAPGPVGAVFEDIGSFNAPVVSDGGGGAFRGEFRIGSGGVTADDDTAIFGFDDAGDLELVVREGDLVSNLLGTSVIAMSEPSMNGLGDIAFGATLGGAGVGASNDRAIVVATLEGELLVVAREGQFVQVAPGDLRVISGVVLRGGFQTSRGRSSFNDAREIALHVSYTDGTQGLLVVKVPEPGWTIFAGMIWGTLYAVRRRTPARSPSSLEEPRNPRAPESQPPRS